MRSARIAIAQALDPGWGVAAVHVVGLIFVTAGWGKIANGFDAVAANVGKVGMPAPEITGPFCSGRLSIDDAWLERRRA